MKVAVLQLQSIGMSSTKLYHFVRIAHKKGVKLLLLGEYMLNPFFKELVTTPVAMIKEQSEHQLSVLKEMAKQHDMVIVAPIIIIKKKEPFKVIAKISPNSISYYHQQLLINYSHWNEEKYFANPIEPIKAPLSFTHEGLRFMIMGGFELHFDPLWDFASMKNVDCVLLPTISTFESYQRWKEIIKTRAFTHNCYVLRANRIGDYKEDDFTWHFYGDSILVAPNGEVEEHLGDREELMIAEIDHKKVLEARRGWGFKEALSKRHLN